MWKEKLILYDQLVDKCPGIERKGKTMPYTSANGYMFSQLNKKGELGIRYSDEVQKHYLKMLNTTEFTSYGSIMKGYVLIPENLWNNLDKLASLLKESYDYVMTLNPT